MSSTPPHGPFPQWVEALLNVRLISRSDQEDFDVERRVELRVPDASHSINGIRDCLERYSLASEQIELTTRSSPVDIGKSSWNICPAYRLEIDHQCIGRRDLQHNDSIGDIRATRK